MPTRARHMKKAQFMNPGSTALAVGPGVAASTYCDSFQIGLSSSSSTTSCRQHSTASSPPTPTTIPFINDMLLRQKHIFFSNIPILHHQRHHQLFSSLQSPSLTSLYVHIIHIVHIGHIGHIGPRDCEHRTLTMLQAENFQKFTMSSAVPAAGAAPSASAADPSSSSSSAAGPAAAAPRPEDLLLPHPSGTLPVRQPNLEQLRPCARQVMFPSQSRMLTRRNLKDFKSPKHGCFRAGRSRKCF
ncbi:hypothetical protein B0T11DRAFT_125973 [Plectosphaerella cucumerina]|uniref:Uncharacterized protein n=1 Tax=Plectosphaerella cucumerina TaxID=40658 RepID=A0A8K0X1H8_9PEZI|nr:hypothetical protein B0T11DRAFT_125973 [Plectosphaerella cucumerina]